MSQVTTKFYGSEEVETSVANQELVPAGCEFRKLSFEADQDCQVRVNGKQLFIRAGRVLNIEPSDPSVGSFIVVNAGITFTWVAV
ncbi:hypothetical protein AM501_02950 [Aneurinibacillus migulanus]|uniref:hypothetical protein n=1 Tax=Aneurinibacillus migulanus TaxID=47500 RepID=UPI0005BA0D02|nr:hypothetical protein [Aneurinibacillus migulanus]KIV50857.1 hypothetical protein TS64_25085 [Aneurinibacillus migulanus]KPD09600.1 hypothetical protein AM501_02950 [Aneurinibacillus migulanus]MCP1358585.1 hypothetical protein [Aneurinibacillus migulanus]